MLKPQSKNQLSRFDAHHYIIKTVDLGIASRTQRARKTLQNADKLGKCLATASHLQEISSETEQSDKAGARSADFVRGTLERRHRCRGAG